MPKIEMIFSDMDGTLLNPQHQLPEATAEAIRAVWRAGIPFVLASSRPPEGMFPFHKQLGIDSPIISYGGALILEGKMPLHSVGLDGQTAAEVYALAQSLHTSVSCSAYAFSDWFTDDTANPWIVQEQEITSVRPRRIDMQALADIDAVHKLLCMGPAADIADLEIHIKKRHPSLAVWRSKDTYLEIMRPGVSKASAVRFLCEKQGVDIAHTLSFGDNYNDLDMLRATGQSVAMGNAPEEIRAQATHVTLDNASDGVGHMLKKLLLHA